MTLSSSQFSPLLRQTMTYLPSITSRGVGALRRMRPISLAASPPYSSTRTENRPRLSITLRTLQEARVISYRYATVTIADRAALEKGSCECYETLRHEAEWVYRP